MKYIYQIDDINEVADIIETPENIDQKGAKYLTSGSETTRFLGEGLWEIKKYKNRLYYIYCDSNCVYLLHTCFKQKGKAEKNDVEIGKKRMKEIQSLTRE